MGKQLAPARAALTTYTVRDVLLSPLGVCTGVLYETWQRAFKDSSLEGSAHQAEKTQPASPQMNDNQQAESNDSHVSESPEKAATCASPCMIPCSLLVFMPDLSCSHQQNICTHDASPPCNIAMA